MQQDKLQHLPTKKPVILENETCVYCDCILDESIRTKEHVIGKKFVPKGKFNAQWNLIVGACKACNNLKSDLENDLSAITMQPDAWGQFAHSDQQLAAEAVRKAKNSFNRRTGNRVADSAESRTIAANFGPALMMKATFVSPPQADHKRVFELSRLQVKAFFYWITYSHATNRGASWPGAFSPINHAFKADWGNAIQQEFMKQVSNWMVRILASTADGFFKVAIRRHPSAFCWSWALEWNHKLRTIGFCGEENSTDAIFSNFSFPQMYPLAGDGNSIWRFREEVGLSENEDQLFSIRE